VFRWMMDCNEAPSIYRKVSSQNYGRGGWGCWALYSVSLSGAVMATGVLSRFIACIMLSSHGRTSLWWPLCPSARSRVGLWCPQGVNSHSIALF